jgi:hypothetical protein
MAKEKRKPGRPPKYLGLTPPLQRAVDNDALQGMRAPVERPQEPVLPEAREDDAQADGEVGVFAAPDDPDPGRHTKAVKPSIPGVAGPEGELRVAVLIRRILSEVAADSYQEAGSNMSNAEVLTRQLVDEALKGKQFAIEAVLDRYEGKPVRANQVQTPDLTIEEQIDRQSVSLLNKMAEGQNK